ncbi:MAG: T9SS type A sorting domain-containing protein [Chlorobi bacterium]|nr:T9SS type A sorting domain-containing protein [Chlorobiota bacterium]
MKTTFYIIILFSCSLNVSAQYFSPAAGQQGSSAIYKDSSIIVSWASECIVNRGYINISDTNAIDEGNNKASFGIAENATGKADNNVVSLGDEGVAILYFDEVVKNSQGFDFVVFENGFSDTFLELAFVEVSSNGERFVRFPSYSNTQTLIQINTFGELDPTYIHNLAGKYRANYGTPFDLQDVADSSGIDIYNIHYIKIIDVIGTLDSNYTTYDVTGNKINDPWPTPFYNGGFDLDAVGILEPVTGIYNTQNKPEITIYPNPTHSKVYIKTKSNVTRVTLLNAEGMVLKKIVISSFNSTIDLTDYAEGFYFIKMLSGNTISIHQIIKID